jgi:hypothetical protein
MEVSFPRSPSHPVTEEGKALHWGVERVIRSWSIANDIDPISMGSLLGAVFPENGIVITDEMVWAGGVYIESIKGRARMHPESLQVEKQLSAHRWIPGYYGRSDSIWRSADLSWLTVWDLKFGYTPVAGIGNWQNLSYGLGAVTAETKTVELIVCQPRGVSASKPIKTWVLPIEEFWNWVTVLVAAAEEARGPTPRTVAGPHCRYCKARGNCDTLAAAGSGAMDTGAAGLSPDLTDQALSHEIELLDRAADAVEARRDALEGIAIARSKAGRVLPGFSYEQGLSNRSWTLPKAQTLAMGQLCGVDLSDSKPVSPNQAQGRGVPRGIIDRFTERQPTRARLVRTDRNAARKAIQ